MDRAPIRAGSMEGYRAPSPMCGGRWPTAMGRGGRRIPPRPAAGIGGCPMAMGRGGRSSAAAGLPAPRIVGGGGGRRMPAVPAADEDDDDDDDDALVVAGAADEEDVPGAVGAVAVLPFAAASPSPVACPSPCCCCCCWDPGSGTAPGRPGMAGTPAVAAGSAGPRWREALGRPHSSRRYWPLISRLVRSVSIARSAASRLWPSRQRKKRKKGGGTVQEMTHTHKARVSEWVSVSACQCVSVCEALFLPCLCFHHSFRLVSPPRFLLLFSCFDSRCVLHKGDALVWKHRDALQFTVLVEHIPAATKRQSKAQQHTSHA